MGSCLNHVIKFECCKSKLPSETPTDEYTDKGRHQRRPTSPSQVQPTVNQEDRIHERCINHEKMLKNEITKLEKQLQDHHKNIQDREEEMINYKQSCFIRNEEERIKNEVQRKKSDAKILKQKQQIKTLQEENDKLLTRLSAIASAKLTDGNANIADLSDGNRPTKLAEQYSELYDNEWTDALGVLMKKETEENAVHILLELFCEIFRACTQMAEEEHVTLTKAIHTFIGKQDVPAEVLKQLKDLRKKNSARQKSDLKKELKGKIQQIINEKVVRKDKNVKRFLNKSIDLCWLMAVQDPPVFVDVNINRSGELHDSTVFKTYTKSGLYIDYIVWPALYLYKNGAILFKGVAQCKDRDTPQSFVYPRTEKEDKRPSKRSRTSSLSIVATRDMQLMDETQGKRCIDNIVKNTSGSSLNKTDLKEIPNYSKVKKKSLSQKIKGTQSKPKDSLYNCQSLEQNMHGILVVPTDSWKASQSNGHLEKKDMSDSASTSHDEPTSNINFNTNDTITNEQELTEINAGEENKADEINEVQTSSDVKVQEHTSANM